ncbi:MAG: hypothetical protein QOE61_5142 [Micromonosporaceae bacterium]|nr:hypothetical protein [Micromonosporaceae bacterium]
MDILRLMRRVVRGRPIPFLAVIVAALAAASCGRSDLSNAVAVRMSGVQAEITYIACSPVALDSVAVLAPTNPDEFRESDPPVWKLSFPKPRPTARTFVVGETPDRAIVDVPLASPLDRDKTYMAVIYLDGGGHIYEAFELDKLDGRVAYNNRYLSADDFARATSCATP